MTPTEAHKKQARELYGELWSTSKTTDEAVQDMRDIAQALADAYESGVRDAAKVGGVYACRILALLEQK